MLYAKKSVSLHLEMIMCTQSNLSYYEKDGKVYTNDERGKARKLASLKSFYHYYFVNELIKTNPADLVSMPKLHEKEIIILLIALIVFFIRWKKCL